MEFVRKRLIELASLTHKNDEKQLSCELDSEDVALFATACLVEASLNEGQLIFNSLEVRNQLVAEHYFAEQESKLEKDSLALLKCAFEIWRNEIGHNDMASGRFLALLHVKQDIFILAALAIENDFMPVFDVLHIVEAALQYPITLSVDSLFTLCSVQHIKTKHDMMNGAFLHRLEDRVSQDSMICIEILNKLRKDITEETASFYMVAACAWSRAEPSAAVEYILVDAASDSILLRAQAIWTLGNLIARQQVPVNLSDLVLTQLKNNINHASEIVRSHAINAIANAAAKISLLDDVLTDLAVNSAVALNALSHLLVRERDSIKTRPHFKHWLSMVGHVSNNDGVTLRNFDYVLADQIKEIDQQDYVVSCLEAWIKKLSGHVARDRSFVDAFQSTFHQIRQQPELLSLIITKWMLQEDSSFLATVGGILSDLYVHGVKRVEFSTPILDRLSPPDLMFLIRRMLGIANYESHLISLTLSLRKTIDAELRVFGFIRQLLGEIGADYPGFTIEQLELLKQDQGSQSIYPLCDEVIQQITQEIKALNELPRVDELKPSPRWALTFAKARAKSMSKTQEKVNKNSILRQLATQVPLKAGIACFSYLENAYTEPSYLHSMSHNYALPSRHVTDTVGYEMQLFMYRIAKRGD